MSQTNFSTPWQQYQLDLKRDDFQHDLAQENAVKHLQRLYEDLVASFDTQPQSFLSKIFSRKATQHHVQGLYFWGGVGRGKPILLIPFMNVCQQIKN